MFLLRISSFFLTEEEEDDEEEGEEERRIGGGGKEYLPNVGMILPHGPIRPFF